MRIELPILAAVVCTLAITFAIRSYRARMRFERMKMSGGRKALVRNLFGD